MAPLINQDIDSLIGGVSQQPSEIRKESQVSALDNATLDPAVGLAKRPGTETVANLNAPTGTVFWHEFDGGVGHRHILRCQSTSGGGSIEAINLQTGAVASVTDNSGNSYSYLADAGRLSFSTVGDTVFCANDAKTVSMATTSESADARKVLMHVLEPPVSMSRKQFIALQIQASDENDNPVSTVTCKMPGGGTGSTDTIDTDSSETATVRLAKQIFAMLNSSARYSNDPDSVSGSATAPSPFNGGASGDNSYQLANSNTSMATAYNAASLGPDIDVDGFSMPGADDTASSTGSFSDVYSTTWNSWSWEMVGSKMTRPTLSSTTDYVLDGQSPIIVGTYKENSTMESTYSRHEYEWHVSSGTDANVLMFTNEAGPLLEQLPYMAPDGFTTRITTDEDSEQDHYYLQYKKEDGAWVEHWKPGEDRALDSTTMPHALTYDRSTSTFTFDEFTWEARKVGDVETHTQPAFVGGHINDLAFFKDRLVFASGQNVVFSETREPGNFWRTTMTQLLDSDRLDLEISAGSQGAGIITSLTPAPQGLFVSTDRAQFLVTSGDNPFTGSNVTIDILSRQAASLKTTPVLAQERLYFTSEYGANSRMWEYVIADNRTGTALDVTGHCPTYVSGAVTSLSTDDVNNTVYAVADNIVYVYRYLQGQQQRLQAAWGRWVFEGSVEYMTTVGDETYFATDSGLGKVLKPSSLDACGWQVHLDWRHTPTNVSSLSGDDEGYFTCDNAIGVVVSLNWLLADLNTGELFLNEGFTVPKFKGDPSGRALVWGLPYEMSVELSPFVLKKSSSFTSRITPYVGGRSQLKTFRVNYHNSGPFTIYTDIGGEVEATTHTHSNMSIGGALEVPPPADGEFLTDVGGNATETTIKIKSDSQLPVELSSANMEVVFYRRGSARTS